MGAREEILARLGGNGTAPLPPPLRLTLGTDGQLVTGPHGADDLWAQFAARLVESGGRIGTWAEAVPRPGSTALVDPDALALVPGDLLTAVHDPWTADLGVTRAEVAVAECGALFLQGGRRLASLTPPVHIAVVGSAAIVATLDDALDHLGDDPAVLIAGPSRTADIEGVLVNGVHGPRELWVIVAGSRVGPLPADNLS